jgi:hypothetical protein
MICTLHQMLLGLSHQEVWNGHVVRVGEKRDARRGFVENPDKKATCEI